GSQTAGRAVAWAAELAHRFGAELVLLRVMGEADPEAEASLKEQAEKLATGNARARLKVHSDASRGIAEGAEEEGADLLVVGNVGMAGRKEFLLGNVPNRVSHNARCTVIIVNTAMLDGDRRALAATPPLGGTVAEEREVEGDLVGRATEVGKTMAKLG